MPRGVSLHIGLNKVDPKAYPPGTVPDLENAENDSREMHNVATWYCNVSTELAGKKATSKNVIEAITAAAAELESGDFFFLSYSGHGGQLPDLSGDEKDDGLDETWVLYDRELIDDELHGLLAKFKSGVRVLVISDSCHSGTVVTDAAGRPRGLTDAQKATIYEHRRAEYQAIQREAKAGGPAKIKASVLLLSACQDDQLASDGVNGNGEFTEALLNTWDSGHYKGSYRQCFEDVRAEMPDDQTPNLLRLGPADEAFEALPVLTFYPGQKGPWNI